MLAKNTHYKYRKNTKCNKIPDLQRKEAKKGPEMSAKIAKVTHISATKTGEYAGKKAGDKIIQLSSKNKKNTITPIPIYIHD